MSLPVASILTFLLIVVVFSPRKWALLGMMAGVLYLSQYQSIDLFGVNLFPIRFLEVAAFVRVVLRKEFSFPSFNAVDGVFVALYSYSTIVFVLRSTEDQAYHIGVAVEAILCYFAFRGLMQSVEDFAWFLGALVILLVPYLGLVVVERLTSYNPLVFVGADATVSWFRGGTPRCVGSFRHPSLFGTLGASFLPLYIGLAFSSITRAKAFIGVALCLGIVWLSNSGGPANAALVGLCGWLLWFARKKMRLVRRSLVGVIILLAVVMNAPVWYLIARVSDLSGGDGWQRAYLIDVAFQTIGKWWSTGMSLRETKEWFPYMLQATGGADITNQFISFGLSAGIGAMVLFILLLALAFRGLGNKLMEARFSLPDPSKTEFLLWGLGVTLSVHVVNWFGITYFDQTHVVWFLQLATISGFSCIHVSEKV